MTLQRIFTPLAGAAALAVAALSGTILFKSSPVHADEGNNDDSKVELGLSIAPVHLNLVGKNRALVGLGSYIVNAQADCNGCHTKDPSTAYTPDGNPYLRFPFFKGKQMVNTATYLGGGSDFGPYGNIPHLYSRNLTPDKWGKPEGGHSLTDFIEIMKHGKDFDLLHPSCKTPAVPNCLMPPFNGELLQVMPWPAFQKMTDNDLHAIYEYLSAVPCNPGPGIAGADYLQNVCH